MENTTTCALSNMLGAIGKLKNGDKWLFINDCNGNVATFMKYKASYLPCYDQAKLGTLPNKDDHTRRIFGAIMNGGTACFDFDLFAKKVDNIDEWFPEDVVGKNFWKCKEFLEYDSIVALGKMHPEVVK